MPYFVVSNFASGRDLRRSEATAPSGSLRVLRNAFINEGGEIEKRKAFVPQADVTAYAQQFKGLVAGPFVCPNCPDTVFFRHRSADLPGEPWVTPEGEFTDEFTDEFTVDADAAVLTVDDPITGGLLQRFWVQRSALPIPEFSALLHGASFSEFASNGYVVEAYLDPGSMRFEYEHVYVGFVGSRPVTESLVAANDGRPYQHILKGKSYVVQGNTLYGSAINDPQDMAGTGSWAVDLTTQGTPIGRTLAIAEYFGQLVVFGRRGMMFWSVDPDPDLNQYLRTIPGSIFAPRTATAYADGDVLFLARSGIRSLQARDSSNEARVSDVGSPIDLEIRKALEPDADDAEPLFGTVEPDVSNYPYYRLAHGVVHQDTGQFWMGLRDKIHVLSRYPASKVLAWSTFDLPDPQQENEGAPNRYLKGRWVADWCVIGETVVLRNFADEVFVYGGADEAQYDDSEAEVVTPFMDMGKPGTAKHFRGIDLVCEGRWFVDFATDPPGEGREVSWARIAEINNTTRGQSRVMFEAMSPQIAIRLTCRSPFAAKVSEIMIYYQEAAQK